MAIVSVSLTEDNLRALDRISSGFNLKGRSEAVRHSIKTAENEMKELSEMSGTVEGVLVIVHDEHGDSWISAIQHRYKTHIKTQLHSHFLNSRCLEIMIISSDAQGVKSILRDIYSTGKADYVKFVCGTDSI